MMKGTVQSPGSQAQESILIRGTHIHFPFRPYRSQLILMNKIIEALETGNNCLLESPTGTGKTLALLCACIAWSQSKIDCKKTEGDKPRRRRIFYGTRTHRQIDQIVDQLRKTDYSRCLKMAILASRQHTCIHPLVSKLDPRSIDDECRKMTVATGKDKSGDCRFDNGRIRNHNDVWGNIGCKRPLKCQNYRSCVFDVNEMVQVGKRLKELAEQSELILCPYNFLLDPRIRDSVPAMVLDQQSIVIFDEAHNIDDLARDALSFLFVKTNIELCLSELGRLESEISMGLVVSLGINQSPGDVMNAIGYMNSRLTKLSDYISRSWLLKAKEDIVSDDGYALDCLEVMVALRAFGLDGSESGIKAFSKAMRVLVEGGNANQSDGNQDKTNEDNKGDVPEKNNLIGENGQRLLRELSLLLQVL
ncbi:hypothetical protein ACOME3_000365 [Neoechinorhynchus agilis]